MICISINSIYIKKRKTQLGIERDRGRAVFCTVNITPLTRAASRAPPQQYVLRHFMCSQCLQLVSLSQNSPSDHQLSPSAPIRVLPDEVLLETIVLVGQYFVWHIRALSDVHKVSRSLLRAVLQQFCPSHRSPPSVLLWLRSYLLQ